MDEIKIIDPNLFQEMNRKRPQVSSSLLHLSKDMRMKWIDIEAKNEVFDEVFKTITYDSDYLQDEESFNTLMSDEREPYGNLYHLIDSLPITTQTAIINDAGKKEALQIYNAFYNEETASEGWKESREEWKKETGKNNKAWEIRQTIWEVLRTSGIFSFGEYTEWLKNKN